MKRNIILLMGLFPSEKYEDIIKASKGNIQYAADALQKSLLQGLSEWEGSLTLVNLPFVGSFPMRYRDASIPSYDFDFVNNDVKVKGYNVSFCNLTGFKLLDRYIRAKKALRGRINLEDRNVILIYSVHTPFLAACAAIKKKNPEVKIVLIVPDLPEFMAQKESMFRHILNRINRRILKHLYRYVDGYVLLSEYMTDRMPINDKPWTVVEGIYNERDEMQVSANQQKSEKYILYSGTLAARYGVMNLVQAFMALKTEDTRLYICGEGDSRNEIQRLSTLDNRIVYKGLIRREEALQLQKNALLLVNPRTPEGEFTKYSFPSKVLEYFASGTPTLMYRLPGIPDEYYEYCYRLEENDIDSLTNKLYEIINLPVSERVLKGRSAREFILKNKNPNSQTKKIIDLLECL